MPPATSLHKTSGTYTHRLSPTQITWQSLAPAFPPTHSPSSSRPAFHRTKHPQRRPPPVPALAMAYHGSSTRVASPHGPQAVFIGFGGTTTTSVPALHVLTAHLNPALALKWACSAAPVAFAIPAGIKPRSMLLPYSDATLIGVVLEGKDSAALKEGAKAVVGAVKDAAVGKVGKEEVTRAVAMAKFQLAVGIDAGRGA